MLCMHGNSPEVCHYCNRDEKAPFMTYKEENESLHTELAACQADNLRLLTLLKEAVGYTSCQAWSPSLTEEINAVIASVKDEA